MTLTDATIAGNTLAYIGESASVDAPQISVLADSTEVATSKTISLALGVNAAVDVTIPPILVC